jgi:hypothetical protein
VIGGQVQVLVLVLLGGGEVSSELKERAKMLLFFVYDLLFAFGRLVGDTG